MATSAAFEGRSAVAIEAAEAARAKMHADMMTDPAMGGMVQHFSLTPTFMNIRFGRWEAILAEPNPRLPFPTCGPCATWRVASRWRPAGA